MARVRGTVRRLFSNQAGLGLLFFGVMFTASYALAQTLSTAPPRGVDFKSVAAERSEAEERILSQADERLHLHLKRLHTLSGTLSGTGMVIR